MRIDGRSLPARSRCALTRKASAGRIGDRVGPADWRAGRNIPCPRAAGRADRCRKADRRRYYGIIARTRRGGRRRLAWFV